MNNKFDSIDFEIRIVKTRKNEFNQKQEAAKQAERERGGGYARAPFFSVFRHIESGSFVRIQYSIHFKSNAIAASRAQVPLTQTQSQSRHVQQYEAMPRLMMMMMNAIMLPFNNGR